jgi:anti-sigma regulatory factor (Ser/Thr protein kinase)
VTTPVSTLRLEPDPQSVKQARAWVVGQLEGIGRPDLTDAAALGVSELVTNAILHGEPPIMLRLGGTAAHPRVEVHDSSNAPPRVQTMSDDQRLLATIGRGLGIVAMYSSTWGAEVSDKGKVVWFEPAPEPVFPDGGLDLTGEVIDLTDLTTEVVPPLGEVAERFVVRLIGMPVQVFGHYRTWYDELRRELRLLALNHGRDYPVAQELSDLTLQVERQRRQARGVDRLDEAIARGEESIDLEYVVPAGATATMARLNELLEEVDAFCREQRLLTLEPTTQQMALRSWYLGEFVRQGRGEAPRRWAGSYQLEQPGT